MIKQEELKKALLDLGVAKVGFCKLEDQLPEKFKHLKSGISIVIRLSDQIISDIHPEDGPTHTYFHHYRTVNFLIDQVTLKATTLLQEWGYLAMAIPASQSVNEEGWEFKGLFPHRTAATRAGHGWIGKNCCLVTEDFGPRVRLGTVLTNMEFEYNQPLEESQCGECNACVKACPAIALKGTKWIPGMERSEIFDPRACSSHMHQQYQKIGRGSVCGICIKVCPKGNKVLRR
ncbi:4Fe-4S double cluster binding domain-containing protein [Alkaliphilus hydrothermalis]|uniref:Epoxyqueuosine reductase QueG n=1 Tax=Alkaliphilus hydrothermalis TaxID=1482730 RepID=A0ABS2NTQ2_9FIRM|nr:4Fe-4S double cluster binding domain-containing protein [Alkaliphilus hydrothermalis]MBM7616327.1 epoxyqueuosine reductase QueG [Alkaliphilus hydrothermalis]